MESNISRCLELLSEIKGRHIVIGNLNILGESKYCETQIEHACLQIRKILELIAFASLVSNIELYKSQYENFAKFWNAEIMLRDMERVNSNFYPQPVTQVLRNGIMHIDNKTDDNYLTKVKFLKVYKKCGAIMHADNPYGSKIDYGYYRSELPKWLNDIAALLNSFSIQFVGESDFQLFQMGSRKQAPTHVSFEEA
ncbi:hypothetical protein O1B50_003878 [Vibrio cholerae]|uniref:hypothetical protein n=1 Tax=Vibrio cholerae TaxID=666 RepID=UPI0011DC1F15|nr:hypothetical protein [Vibrio cholerae]EKF9303240.1 hypothetical protein [Vibrio cholerae]TXX58530.1 hypothetical protein FXF06_07205 [Vibrio cholerae]GIB61680.1 hypothetical protein VCSRO140_3591 [Vibrio cholerae]